ncbi:MAG TPA: tetratricopeptide repeat protein [Thermoanaerobaculia bacterium]|nr:tetratricopeptide repeat protein [Thermoanaerobaculia bacterium]
MKAEPGTRFGPYEIVHSLGGGGMGDVFRARDVRLGRDLAIKFLRDELAENRLQLHRFEREARAASALNHPSIITIYEVGEHDGHPYIAMEYVEGRRLRDVLSEGSIPVDRGLDIAVSLADALAAAHARGIIHRDLKPENVMITPEWRVKILDFGLAKPADAPTAAIDSNAATMPGVVVGTAGYMAPEQAKGIPADFRSDQFSLGTMLYEVFSGRSPFRRGTSMETISAILRDTQRPLTEVNPAVPAELAEVVDRCLQKEPADRYASTSDLAHDLRQIHKRFTTGTHPLTPPVRRGFVARRGTVILAILGALLALAALVAVVRTGREAPPEGAAARARLPVVKSLVILPFRETSGDSQWQLIAEGMSETVSARLALVDGLQVIPPSALPRDKEGRDIKTLAKNFAATLALTTTVSRSGDRLRASYSLLDPGSGVQLAGGTIDGMANDLWGLEDRIADRIAAALEVQSVARSKGDLLSPDVQDRFLTAAGALQRYDDPAMVDQAIALLEPLAESNPQSALVHAALGRAYQFKYEATKDPRWAEEAITTSRKASRLDSAIPEVHVTLGKLFVMTGKPEEAVRELERALELRANDFEALLNLGRAYQTTAPDRAEQTIRKAIERRPNYWTGYSHLGVFFQTKGRYPEAAEMFSKVVELTPDNSRGWTNLGGAYLQQGLFEESIEPFRRATELQPSNPSAFSNLGTGYYYVGRLEEARTAFTKAAALAPDNARFRLNLGDVYHAMGRKPEARAAYDEGIRLARISLKTDPTDVLTHQQLILAYSRTGQARRARYHLEKALEGAPQNGDVMWFAALMFLEQGDRDEGAAWLEKAIAAGADPKLLAREPALRPFRADPQIARIIDASPPGRGDS